MGRREEQKEKKRQKILRAAKDVFLEKGYHSTSIADIIRKTDLARGTFYLYFKNKQQIFDTLIAELFFSLSGNIYSLEVEKIESLEKLESELMKLFVALTKTIKEHRELVKIVLSSSSGLDNEFDKKVEGYDKLMVDVIKLMLKRGIESKKIKPYNPQLFAHLIYGGIKENVHQWLNLGTYSDEEFERKIPEVIAIYMRGAEI